MSKTEKLGLEITDTDSESFSNWWKKINGPDNSNMHKIEAGYVKLENEINKVSEKVSNIDNVYIYKGSVKTYNDLPTENLRAGDVYNVIDTGKNYAWDGEKWDSLSGVQDMRDYPTKEETQTMIDASIQTSITSALTADYIIGE